MSYGIGVAKIDGDNIRTLSHTDILQTKDLWIHFFENVGMQRFELKVKISQHYLAAFGAQTCGEYYQSISSQSS